MFKADDQRLRTQRQRSAETAREQDPQHAAIYYDQMVNKGSVHLKTNGTPIDSATAKQIIAQRFTVPEQIRRQRRSKKKGVGGPLTKSSKDMHQVDARSATTRGDPPEFRLARQPATVKTSRGLTDHQP